MTKNLNIALLSDVPPDSHYTAGQVLRKILENTEFAQVDFYWLNQSRLASSGALPKNCGLVFQCSFAFGKIQHKWRVGLEKLFGWVPKFRSLLVVSFALMRPVYFGIRLGLKIRYSRDDILWMVLQGERLAITYWIISKICNKPFILQQWDPVSWWLNNRGYPAWLSSKTSKLVKSLERRAKLNLVPSHAWLRELQAEGLPTCRIDNFFMPGEPVRGLPVRVTSDSQLNAVFLGQLYSNAELVKILASVAKSCQQNGLEFVLHYFGSSINDFSMEGVRIVNHGHVDRESLIARIAKWDFGILPYPTEHKFADASRLSFPSKARVYVASGLPIISFSALDSSPHQFLSFSYPDLYLNLLDGDGHLEEFLRLCRDSSVEALLRRFAQGSKVIEEHFSAKVELAPFHQFLRGLN